VERKKAFVTLQKLRGVIAGILEENGITVLPAEQWRKPVPWLRAGEAVCAADPVRVLDALFFEEL
jgi:hypothetical protein